MGIDVSKNTSLIDYREMIKEKIKKNLSVTKKKNEPSFLVNTTQHQISSRKEKPCLDDRDTDSPLDKDRDTMSGS